MRVGWTRGARGHFDGPNYGDANGQDRNAMSLCGQRSQLRYDRGVMPVRAIFGRRREPIGRQIAHGCFAVVLAPHAAARRRR
jgi:hypothetical protein